MVSPVLIFPALGGRHLARRSSCSGHGLSRTVLLVYKDLSQKFCCGRARWLEPFCILESCENAPAPPLAGGSCNLWRTPLRPPFPPVPKNVFSQGQKLSKTPGRGRWPPKPPHTHPTKERVFGARWFDLPPSPDTKNRPEKWNGPARPAVPH